MEKLNEIIVVLKKVSQGGKGLYLDNIKELYNKDYNMEKANVISKLNKKYRFKYYKESTK